MAVLSFKCPNCDGELIFDPAIQQYKCEYCDSAFTQEEWDALTPEKSTEQERNPASGDAEAGETSEAVLYTCPSCGAEIITDATTAATFCYYCHNPVILGGRLEGAFLPDKVIPFEITKEEAVKRFLAYVERKRFVPRAFFSKQQMETITGVYFPYWNYQAEAESVMQGEGRRIRSWTTGNTQYTETKCYRISRKGKVSLANLTENALQKANADLARGVMPYNFDKMQEFRMGYLSGFMAEKWDIEKETLTEKMQNQVRLYADKMMRSTIENYSSVSVENSEIQFKEEQWSYCLLPVWTITYKGRDGRIYYYSMNGQTGEVCGELPVDKKKLGIVSGAVSAAILILGLIGGFLS